jgi:hypothetical protein
LTYPSAYGIIGYDEKTEVVMEEVLEIEENGEYTVYTYTVYVGLGETCVKSHYETLEDVKRFHPDLEV